MTWEQAEDTYAKFKQARADARNEYREQLRRKAEKNHDYVKAVALEFTKHRAAGKGVEESKILAKADAAHLELERDLADAEAKAAGAHLEELEAGRASFRQLIDWMRAEGG